VAGVDQLQVEPSLFEQVPDRLPVLAGRLHHHLSYLLGHEPIGQCFEPKGERRERADFLAATTPIIGTRTHATTSSLATSNPEQRATTTSMTATPLSLMS
jgi:hypothetical protein